MKKNFTLEGKVIKNESDFRYLGLEIQEEVETKRKINRRLWTLKRAIAALNFMLQSRDIITNTKKIIENTIIESILLYGAETWTISKANKKSYQQQK